MSPVGSFATGAADLACRFMSASVRERPTSGVVAKCHDGPNRRHAPVRSPCESHLTQQPDQPSVCKKRLLDYGELSGFADLGTVTVSETCQANEFAKVSSRLVVVTYRFSRLSGSVETAHPLRRTIHRSFVFDQRCGRVALFQQKIGEQLAHWIQPIFHRHVFLAIVFAVRCGAHQPHSFCPATLCVRVPTLCGENL